MYNKKIFQRYLKPFRVKRLLRYFQSMNFLIKSGYDDYVTYETFDWFIVTMKDILTKYQKNKMGTPYLLKDNATPEEQVAYWDSLLNKMISLLDEMDECNPKYEHMSYKEQETNMVNAKDEFFKIFSEVFYHLWD